MADSKQTLRVSTYTRSLTKAISWRALGTLDTILLSFLVTGTLTLAVGIGLTELLTKTLLYFLHERVWNRIRWRSDLTGSRLRSLAKSVSWRLVGTIDTIIIAYVLSGNTVAAFSIGGFELFTKIILYYLHERVWSRVNWGMKQIDV